LKFKHKITTDAGNIQTKLSLIDHAGCLSGHRFDSADYPGCYLHRNHDLFGLSPVQGLNKREIMVAGREQFRKFGREK
jgi:hypothetical protein